LREISNMIISSNHKYVYISTPKAGTHSLYDLLVKHFDGKKIDGPYHNREIPSYCLDSNYKIFTTVRNPLSRTLSIWNSLTQRENYKYIYLKLIGSDKFLDFVKWITTVEPSKINTGKGRILLHRQSVYLRNLPIDYFIKIEHLNIDFPRLGIGQLDSYPHMLSRSYTSWDMLKCETSSRILREWLLPDYDFLGYDIDLEDW